jgi:hypothetical protein
MTAALLIARHRMALIHGRPSHINEELDWTVESLRNDDFDEDSEDKDQVDGSGDIETGRLTFKCLISLSQILNDRLRTV